MTDVEDPLIETSHKTIEELVGLVAQLNVHTQNLRSEIARLNTMLSRGAGKEEKPADD